MPEKAGAPPDARKIVTVVFCDLVDSTHLGERLDPEAFGPILEDFYDLAQKAFRRHEGTVQDYKGDAVLAAFGVPTMHEDDALRAVIAAAELRIELVALNDALYRDRGMRLAVRMGVNTGEVAVNERSIVVGDAVNVAARLQQVAGADEVLVGQRTRDLVRRVTKLEQLPGLALKGKQLPVPAWRLLGVDPDARDQGRSFDTPIVGRDHDLAMLQKTYERTVADQSCHLVTVLGEAGVGKTRLVNEFARQLDDEAIILKGWCPRYGENVDYWPLLQGIRQAAGIQATDDVDVAMARLSSLTPGDDRLTMRLAQMLGLREGTGSAETVSWALGRLIGMMATSRPVVLVIDDLHWAMPKLVGTLEQIVHRSDNTPVLIVCMTREPPAWSSRLPNMNSFTLTVLDEEQIGQLITNRLGEGRLDPTLRQRLAEAALGYPLYAEEYIGMLQDQKVLYLKNGQWVLSKAMKALPTPGSIEMLLAARLEELSPEERSVIGAAAVIGPRFPIAAVAVLTSPSLAGDEQALEAAVRSLKLRGLLRPDSDPAATETGNLGQFRHLLIYETAYRALAKKTRANLHEQYVAWLAQVSIGDAALVEEELALHLKAAYQLRVELGETGEALADLRCRAGERLASAGTRVARRGDAPDTAARLLSDAVRLLPAQHPEWLEAQLFLAESWREAIPAESVDQNQFADIIAAYDLAIERANRASNRKVELTAQLGRLELVWFTDLAMLLGPEAARVIRDAWMEFEWLRDDLGLARTWHLNAYARAALGRTTEARRAAEHAIRLAQRAQDQRLEGRSRQLLCFILDWGPTPVSEVTQHVQQTLEWAEGQGMRSVAVGARNVLARIYAMQGHFDAAGAQLRIRNAARHRTSEPLLTAPDEITDAEIHLLADNPVAAERTLRAVCDQLTQVGGKGPLANVTALLARTLLLQGRLDEAERAALTCQQTAPEVQLEAQIRGRLIQAVVQARRGQAAEAEQLAREAATRSEHTEQPDTRAQAMYDLAEVLGRAGRWEDAVAAARRARELWEGKGNLVGAQRPGRLLEELGSPVPIGPGGGDRPEQSPG